MVEESVEAVYFNWLCAKVQSPDVRSNYRQLLELLYRTEFVWVNLYDENRAMDGVELRLDFLRETRFEKDHTWYESPCSVLESLIAFAQRAEFQTEMPVAEWFWKFMENLRLDEYRRMSEDDVPVVHGILDVFMARTYSPTGDGGLFPLRKSDKDQREVEIWYQFCEYVLNELNLF